MAFRMSAFGLFLFFVIASSTVAVQATHQSRVGFHLARHQNLTRRLGSHEGPPRQDTYLLHPLTAEEQEKALQSQIENKILAQQAFEKLAAKQGSLQDGSSLSEQDSSESGVELEKRKARKKVSAKPANKKNNKNAASPSKKGTVTQAKPNNQNTASNKSPAPGFAYGSTKVRGVSLGGWLVLEPWIKPSMFQGLDQSTFLRFLDPEPKPDGVVDEWTFSANLGYNEAYKRLHAHWSTWITEADFAQIASYGLNHVRIPIGFWAIIDLQDGEPYVKGSYDYLKQAVGWAAKHNIKVMIDLHGAPGSQNGFDESGRMGDINWPYDQANVDRTKDVVQALATEFSQSKYKGAVTSIEPLNEPAGFVGDSLMSVAKQFFYDAYAIVRYPGSATGNHNPSNFLYVLQESFQPLSYWYNFMPKSQYQNVAMDTHIYTMFTDDGLRMTPAQRIKSICNMASSLKASDRNIPTFVGEFGIADTECAGEMPGEFCISLASGYCLPYRSIHNSPGRSEGSAYDGSAPGSSYIGSCGGKTGSGAKFTSSFKAFLRKFWEVQVTVYEQFASGWIMWNWKMETADEWSYQKGVQYGWIPKDPTERMYGKQC